MAETQSKGQRRPSEFFEWKVIAGPFKGNEARVLGQSSHEPDYVDVEFRHERLTRGPFRVPWDWLQWIGPR